MSYEGEEVEVEVGGGRELPEWMMSRDDGDVMICMDDDKNG